MSPGLRQSPSCRQSPDNTARSPAGKAYPGWWTRGLSIHEGESLSRPTRCSVGYHASRCGEGFPEGFEERCMQDRGYELPRIAALGNPVNRSKEEGRKQGRSFFGRTRGAFHMLTPASTLPYSASSRPTPPDARCELPSFVHKNSHCARSPALPSLPELGEQVVQRLGQRRVGERSIPKGRVG